MDGTVPPVPGGRGVWDTGVPRPQTYGGGLEWGRGSL